METKGRHNAPNARARGERRGERASNQLILRLSIAVILAAAAFCGGFALRSQTDLIDSWGIPVSDEESEALATAANRESYDTSITARVRDVEQILSTYSLDEINLTEATYTMLADLMKSTGDPYAAYYNPDLYNNYIKESTDRSYAGIGVVFADYNGRAYVADVFEGSEAEAKGVQQGDFLMTIDGTDVSAWSMTEVVNALAKDEGDNVSITWMRPSSLDAQTGDQFTTALVCKVYEEANLTTDLTRKVGVIKLRQITSNAAELVQQAVESLTTQGATAFVLDLRDNPGGYLTQAVDIASLFVSSGVLVEVQNNEGEPTEKSAAGVSITEAPMVVLVNKYTAAAAEVLAAALLDNQRATVVGETTLGKGSVQVVRELDFGGAVRYTAAYYLTPRGHAIDGVGIVPQVTVVTGDADGADEQMALAVDTARSLAKKAK
ncbi:S41 family peptidase [Adlercreutzia caecimuris]|jgi:carboxyl-terminal processing protease|uniref:PDZ domain-containing protein n=1 Tax=Adlercreutzia caecimuris TaxID=671266 RepID=A0A4V3WUW6_9ACTN|nr:S41 family peptidase [Adlercreutzia caecimuris]MCI9206947.1 PDZ domain-containing protein [Adlercreutzia caecimuris]NBJ67546.1 PDZ domain-containing protein [Adlercreutzia caecimuris]THG37467.1 PDZ domain-containing protein [Adlercreutzia caecimuris]